MAKIERPKQVIFIRHAESARNAAKPKNALFFPDEEARRSVEGIPDHKIAITPTGIIQAQKTGLYLRERFGRPDYAYHSGYVRTKETLEYILSAFPKDELSEIKIRMNQFIRERDPGFTYDMMKDESDEHFPYLQKYWETFGGYFARPPGGESLCDVSTRVYEFLGTLFHDRAGQKVWVVIHGGSLRAVRFWLEKWDYQKAEQWQEGEQPENCGITVYNYNKRKSRLELQEYNTVAWK